MGVFSTRSPHHPNPIGMTLAKIEDVSGDTVQVSGIDLIDGTPILDIKPYLPDYDLPRVEKSCNVKGPDNDTVQVPSWINSESSKLAVEFTPSALRCLDNFPVEKLEHLKSGTELKNAIGEILKADPRSRYRKDNCEDKLYYMTVDNAHVTTWFDDSEGRAEVLKVVLVGPNC